MERKLSTTAGGHWTLTIGWLSDGAECLCLKKASGTAVCWYSQAEKPYQDKWHSYFNGFPKQEFSSREAVIRNAELLAGPAGLKIVDFDEEVSKHSNKEA